MKIHHIKGYTIVLDKVVFISSVFVNDDDSLQFNVKMVDDKLVFRYPDRASAVLARETLVQALKEA